MILALFHQLSCTLSQFSILPTFGYLEKERKRFCVQGEYIKKNKKKGPLLHKNLRASHSNLHNLFQGHRVYFHYYSFLENWPAYRFDSFYLLTVVLYIPVIAQLVGSSESEFEKS